MLYTFIYIAIALHQRTFTAHAVLQVLYALTFLLIAGLLSGYALGFVAAARLFLLLLQSGLVCLPALCLCFLALTVALGLAPCLLVSFLLSAQRFLCLTALTLFSRQAAAVDIAVLAAAIGTARRLGLAA